MKMTRKSTWNHDRIVWQSICLCFCLYWLTAIFETAWRSTPLSIAFSVLMPCFMLLILIGKKLFIVNAAILACLAVELTQVPGLGILCVLFCSLFLWGYIERNSERSIFLPIIAIIILEFLYHYFNRNNDLSGDFLYILCCLTPWILGKSLLQKNKEQESMQLQARLQESERRLERKERDEALAQMLHDSITGDLSLIALIANGHEHTNKDYDSIIELAQSSLHKLHSVIDILDDNDSERENAIRSFCYGSDISALCHEKDRQLSRIGHAGSANISGNMHVPVNLECLQLVQELYTNILRHCKKCTYIFVIKISKEGVAIMESNSCDDENGIQMQGGSGLTLHQNTIESLGGHFTANKIEDSWIVNAWIPNNTPYPNDVDLDSIRGGSSFISIFQRMFVEAGKRS